MKKMIAFIVAFMCIFAFSGCVSQDNSQDSEYSIVVPLTCFTAEKSSLSEPDLEISQEQAEFIITVWNDSSWEKDITKTKYDYVFRGDNIEVRYCYDAGIFNDVINNRHVVLTSDMKAQVNQTIDKFIVLPVID